MTTDNTNSSLELIALAIQPVLSWYVYPDQPARPLHEIISDIVTDVQDNRSELLEEATEAAMEKARAEVRRETLELAATKARAIKNKYDAAMEKCVMADSILRMSNRADTAEEVELSIRALLEAPTPAVTMAEEHEEP